MSDTSAIFIRAEHRPDLRAALGPQSAGSVAAPNCFASFPRSYQFSGCNEKSDKADKTKEVGKDDKAHRAPVKDHVVNAFDGPRAEDMMAANAYATMFA